MRRWLVLPIAAAVVVFLAADHVGLFTHHTVATVATVRTGDGGKVKIIGPVAIRTIPGSVRGDGNVRIPANGKVSVGQGGAPLSPTQSSLLHRLSSLTGIPSAQLYTYRPGGRGWLRLWQRIAGKF